MLDGRLRMVATGVIAAVAVIVALVRANAMFEPGRQPIPSRKPIEAGQATAKTDAANAADFPEPVGPRIKGLVVDTSGRPVGGARVSAMRSDRPRSVIS
jgi:hypothetical protein